MIGIGDALRDDPVRSYVSYVGDRAFSTGWMLYEGRSEGDEEHHRLVFLGETDLTAAGLAGPVQRMRAELRCRDDLQPVDYRVTTDHAVNRARFGPGHVQLTLPSGEERRVPLERFEAIVGQSVAQLALYLRLHEVCRRPSHHAELFSLEGVTVFGYQLERVPGDAPGGGCCVDSSMQERLTIAADGWLVRHEDRRAGVVTLAEQRSLPAWRDEQILRPVPQYRVPDDARFTLVDVEVPVQGTRLGGTVSVPEGPGPHPAVLFLGGTGSHDRHGFAGELDLGSHELVDHLSDHGWLGARFDTRGAGGSGLGENFLELGYEEAIHDARALLEHVRRLPAVDPARVALVGHSQGALVAAELARSAGGVLAVVMLAPPGRPAEEVLRDQIAVRAAWLSQGEAQRQAQVEDFDEFVRLVRSDVPWDRQHVPDRFYPLKRLRKWYAEVLSRDPVAVIAQVPCPLLICQGGKDFQVSLQRDTGRITQWLASRGVAHELAVFPDLDHLFKPVEGEPHIRQYYDPSRRVHPALLDRVRSFLDHCAANAGGARPAVVDRGSDAERPPPR